MTNTSPTEDMDKRFLPPVFVQVTNGVRYEWSAYYDCWFTSHNTEPQDLIDNDNDNDDADDDDDDDDDYDYDYDDDVDDDDDDDDGG